MASTAQGVTNSEIKIGVFSDVGFTKNPEFVDAAKVFTSWCNDAGGINGRKLVPVTHDSKLVEVRQRMIEACRSDFALAGGGAALDGMGVKDRLNCLLPDFPAQTSQAIGADLQVTVQGAATGYSPYGGYFSWLLKEAYPASASSVGIIAGDSPVVKPITAQDKETLTAAGGKITYSDLYPAQGVSDWTPYAQAIKNKKVKGLVFLGDFASLAKLEQVLTNIGYAPDWIDANSNAYGAPFIQAAGKSLSFQHNYADIWAVYPLEQAESNPATQQVIDLYGKYAPGQAPTLQALQAFSAWLIFAASAETCGSNLTRSCVYNAAVKQTAWTGGGLTAPVNLAQPDSPPKCFDIEQATPNGWQAASFGANNGPYRCGAPVVKLTGNFPQPVTLASVGKSLSDLK
jgi:ABC-type branched-subunit amino acid transport system substrate-binding protein